MTSIDTKLPSLRFASFLPLSALLTAASLSSLGCSADLAGDDADQEPPADQAALTLDGYVEPSAAQAAAALAEHASLDPGRLVPRDLLGRAVAFFDLNQERIQNKKFISVIDFSRHSSKKRLFIVDVATGAVEAHVVAHGSGSDPSNSGYARRFSNVEGSNASSLGYYVTAETYQGNNGYSLRLDGVSDTNSNARSRAVVMHGAHYVEEGRSQQGRSWGCPAVSHDVRSSIINRIKGGSVLYIDRAGREE